MEMQGNRQLAISQQQSWQALNDPEVLRACIPGCGKFELVADNQYSVEVALKIGPIAAKFAGKIKLSDIHPPQSYTLSFEGQGGPAGFAKGSANVQLSENAEGHELGYVLQAKVGGKIAQLGQRLIDGAAKSVAEDFFKRFEEEMRKRYPDAYAERPAAPAPAARPYALAIPLWVWLALAAAAVALFFALR